MSNFETTFYVTGGTLRSDAPSYVERQADADLLDGLLKGEFCYVLTSRQMGKSSLMVRTANKLRAQGIAVAVLDLTAIGQNLTPEQWYDGLIARMGRQLDLESALEGFWKAHLNFGPCQRFFDAIRDVALPKSPKSLVIFIDEIDVARSLPFSTDEFFAAIRENYNRRSEGPELKRLTFCLLGVATPSDLIRDTRTTPFNVGRRIELNDFTPAEAAPLGRGLGPESAAASERPIPENAPCSALHASRLLDRILFWTEGHPYLTQRLCGAVVEKTRRPAHRELPNLRASTRFVDDLCHELFFSERARECDDNLIFVRERILRSDVDRASLLHLYEKVLRGARLPDDERNPLVSVLRLAGIVRVTGGRLRDRNRIYERVFDHAWVRANMPDAETRRQRAAFRHGVLRATAIAGVVVVAMIVMVLIAMSEAAKARRALAQSYLSQARAGRMSGVSGQRYDSLKALREARRYHANEVVLRDEVIACLALPDLKEKTDPAYLKRTNVSELNLDLGISATAEMDGSVALRNLKDEQLLRTLPGFGLTVRQLRFSPKESFLLAEYDGDRRTNRLLTAALSPAATARERGESSEEETERRIVVWDWQKGQKLFELPYGIHAGAVDFSSGKLALGQNNGRVAVYALPGGEVLQELELKWESGLPRVPQALRFNPSGELLAESCLDDLNVQVWDLNNGQKVWRLYHPDKVFDLAWHPQGELLATGCGDACIYLWDTNRTDKPIKKLIGHENGVKAIAFNHRGTLLATAGLDETLRLWMPAADRQVSRRLEGEMFERLQFSSKDDVLTASPEGSRCRAWDVSGDEYVVLQMRTGPADKLKTIDFSPDGKWLAAASGERTMIWDCSSGRESGAISLVRAHAASFSADSRHLIASTDDGLFQYPLREMTNDMQPRLRPGIMQPLANAPAELDAMALSLDRTTAALVHQGEVRVVPLADTNLAARAISAGKHYRWLALQPKALWMAGMITGSSSIDLWNLSENAGAQGPFAIPGSEYFVFSPDGKWLVTCWGGQFQFYRVGAWQTPALLIPRVPASYQHAPIAFTQDGTVVALASSRYTIHLLRLTEDVRTAPKVIASLESPDRSPLEILAFSPDGRRLAAATANLTIQLWNLTLLRERLAELDLDHDWPKSP